MKTQKDHDLEAPGEANRDKHINFLAQENGDVDPSNDETDDEINDTIDEDADTFEVNEDDDLNEDNDLDEKDSNMDDDSEDDDVTNEDDNGFFTDDDNELETEEEKENEDKPSTKSEKVQPLEPDTHTTLGDKITVNSNNEDLFTVVIDDNDSSFLNKK